jgi:hypothetical protein
MQKRRKREATTLLNDAKKTDTHNVLSEQIKMMQQQLKDFSIELSCKTN